LPIINTKFHVYAKFSQHLLLACSFYCRDEIKFLKWKVNFSKINFIAEKVSILNKL